MSITRVITLMLILSTTSLGQTQVSFNASLERTEFLSGEMIWVEVVVRNEGETPVDVPTYLRRYVSYSLFDSKSNIQNQCLAVLIHAPKPETTKLQSQM